MFSRSVTNCTCERVLKTGLSIWWSCYKKVVAFTFLTHSIHVLSVSTYFSELLQVRSDPDVFAGPVPFLLIAYSVKALKKQNPTVYSDEYLSESEWTVRKKGEMALTGIIDLGVTWHFEIQLTWNFFDSLSNLVGFFSSTHLKILWLTFRLRPKW